MGQGDDKRGIKSSRHININGETTKMPKKNKKKQHKRSKAKNMVHSSNFRKFLKQRKKDTHWKT